MPAPLRVLVIGGRGFLGRRTVSALRRIEGVEVVAGSRREIAGGVVVDVSDYSSRTAMDGFDFVVNCSDSLAACPQRAAEFCLLRGITFVETSAAAGVLEALWADARDVPEPAGALVVGVGLFPGLSNLLAADLLRRHPGARRLEVGVRYSPWSQAGGGVCRLMADAMAGGAVRYEDGVRVVDPPLTVAGRMAFLGAERTVLGVALPESTLLHWSTGVPSTGAVLAPRPPLPLALQRLLALLAPWNLLRWRPVRWLSVGALQLLRGQLLRWHRAPVELSAALDRDPNDPAAAVHGGLRVSSGFEAAACAVAATVRVLAGRRPAPGVYTIDQLVELDEVLAGMEQLSRGELGVQRG